MTSMWFFNSLIDIVFNYTTTVWWDSWDSVMAFGFGVPPKDFQWPLPHSCNPQTFIYTHLRCHQVVSEMSLIPHSSSVCRTRSRTSDSRVFSLNVKHQTISRNLPGIRQLPKNNPSLSLWSQKIQIKSEKSCDVSADHQVSSTTQHAFLWLHKRILIHV